MEYDNLTKKMLQEELEKRKIEYEENDTKEKLLNKLKNSINTETRYTKEQILNKQNPGYNVDAMYVVLDDDKTYTKDEAMKLYHEFMNKEIQ